MDKYSGQATANVATQLPKHLSKDVNDGGQCSAVGPFPFDSYDLSKSHFPNNCFTLFAGEAFHDEASIDLGLSINSHLNIDMRAGKMDMFCRTSKAPTLERPKLDLELSLSTGAFTSAISTLTEGSVHFQGVLLAPVTGAAIQHVDEGSTSSRWKVGHLLPPLRSTETITVVRHDPSLNNPSPVIPGLTSNISVPQKSSFACASGATLQKQRDSKAPTLERPKLDLELSLSTGAFASAISTLTEGSVHFQGVLLAPVTGAAMQHVDEGSTSSRWKVGHLLPPLRSTETITVVRHDPSLNNPSPVIPGLTSNISVPQKSSFACASGATLQKQRDSKAPTLERPKLDLELSLSTGAFASAISTLTEGSVHFQGILSASVTGAAIQHVDEGSTSSRWKVGPLLPPLRSTETITVVRHDPSHNNPSPVIPGLTSNISVPQRSSCACASGATLQKQRDSRVKPCQFSGCSRGARGASGFCIRHGGGNRCQKGGCHKGAEGKTIFCKAHGGGRRCQYTGCLSSADGRTEFCIRHGGGRQCSHIGGCTTAARGKSGKCIKHGGGKRCKIENCPRSAEGITSLCIAHGGGRRCQYTDCTKGAQGRTMLCKAHGGGKRCTVSGCSRGAEGATSLCKGHGGGKRCTFEGGCTTSAHGGTLFCVKHGGGKRCAIAECTTSARGRTNFCVRHGGGKRCKYEGCDKSAQGRTDFCKGHGGSKRSSWGQSGLGGQAIQMNIDSGLYHARNDLQGTMFEKMKGICCYGNNQVDAVTTTRIEGTSEVTAEDSYLPQLSLPEGRVHGGSLMAMLRGNTSTEQSNNDNKVGSSLYPGISHSTHHRV